MKISLHHILFVLLALLSPVDLVSAEPPPEVKEKIPDARLVGDSKVTMLFFELYDVSLFAPEGVFSWDRGYSIHLRYHRPIEGKVIARASVEEMRRQGVSEVKLAAWYEQLKEIFPDVSPGTELSGIFEPNGVTCFYRNDQMIGKILDPDFARPFSSIWLGENTRKPRVREQLLGPGAS